MPIAITNMERGELRRSDKSIAAVDQQPRAPLGATCVRVTRWFESVSLVVSNIMPLQKFDIFFLKRFAAMMIFLVVNIIDYRAEMGMRN